MNCDGVRGLLSAYLDGELSPGELLRVEQHLRRCPACADEVDSLRQTIALVASLDEVEVPASFHTQLHERLAALEPPIVQERRSKSIGRWQRHAFRWVVPAAAAAVAAFAIGLTALPQARNLEGLEGRVGSFLSPSDGSTSNTIAQTGVGRQSGAGESNGKSESAVSQSGEVGPDSSGGSQAVAGDFGGSAVSGDATGSNLTIPGVSGGDARAAGAESGGSQVPEDLEPMYSYSITLTTSGVSQQELVEALQEFRPRSETNMIVVTVSADERASVVAAVQSVPGIELSSGSAETAIDLAPQIYDTTSRLEADQQQLKNLQEQMATLEDPEALSDARGLQKVLEERIAESSAALERMQDQVNTALITVEVQP